MPVHRPSFDGTTKGEWNKPDLEDFGEDPDLSEVDDHFIGSRTEFPPENYGDLAWPVVKPNGDLSINALRAAASMLSQTQGFSEDEMQSARDIVAGLAEDNFDDAEFSDDLERIIEKSEHLPENDRGLNSKEVLDRVENEGKWSKQRSQFRNKAEEPNEVCGACLFFQRQSEGSTGRCRAVKGLIPWSASCDLFISAQEEAEVNLGHHEDEGGYKREAVSLNVVVTGKEQTTKGEYVYTCDVPESSDHNGPQAILEKEGHSIGQTLSTQIEAAKGDILQVEVEAIKTDGATLSWEKAKAVRNKGGEADVYSESDVITLAKNRGVLQEDMKDRAKEYAYKAIEAAKDDELPSSAEELFEEKRKRDDSNEGLSNVSFIIRARSADEEEDDEREVQQVDRIIKADDERQIFYAVAIEPNEVDAHGDEIPVEEIYPAAKEYINRSRTIGLQHERVADASLHGSMVVPPEWANNIDSIKAHTWAVAIKVHDDRIWKGLKEGDFEGVSIGGFAR